MDAMSEIGIYWNHRVALLSLSVILLCVVLELVRRDLLKERYALLWMATSVAGLFFGFFPGLIVAFAEALRFQYLTVLFSLSFFFTLGLVLTFSVVISRLSERNKALAQEVALLTHHVNALRERNERD